jgi:hypothetical protein
MKNKKFQKCGATTSPSCNFSLVQDTHGVSELATTASVLHPHYHAAKDPLSFSLVVGHGHASTTAALPHAIAVGTSQVNVLNSKYDPFETFQTK